MKANQLLIGVVLVGMVACYGCLEEPEPTEMLVCSDAEAPITVEGRTIIKLIEDSIIQTNNVTGNFLYALANGVLDGNYFDPGDNQFDLALYDAVLEIYYHIYWNDADITVYGGSGTVDSTAFVGSAKTYGHATSYSQNVYFNKDTTSGVSFGILEIANNSFTDTVSIGDYCIVAWIFDFDITQPLTGGFFLTDTISYALAEGLAQNTSVPYIHKLRFIYSNADTNLVSPYKDSIWYDSDTINVKVFVWASDSARDGTDSCYFIDMLDSYGRLWKRDTIRKPVPANQYVTGRPNLYWERDPEIL